MTMAPGGRDDLKDVPGLVTRLADDTKRYVRAEIALYKAQAVARIGYYRSAAVYGVIAAVLLLSALVALLVGLILSLATVLGPLAATLIVVGATVLLAVILGLMARTKVRSASEAVKVAS